MSDSLFTIGQFERRQAGDLMTARGGVEGLILTTDRAASTSACTCLPGFLESRPGRARGPITRGFRA